MHLPRNCLKNLIKELLSESQEIMYKKTDPESSELGVDPRYSSEELVIHCFPFNKKFEHEGAEFPKKTFEWAQWQEFPTNFLSKNFCWIPPEQIPQDYKMPLSGETPEEYIGVIKVFKLEPKVGKIPARPSKTLKSLIKLLRNPRAWAYGTQTTPMLPHPENGKIMIPLEWSVLFAGTEKRASIYSKRIKEGKNSIFHYTKTNGYGNDGKAIGLFRKDLNEILRDENKHVSREEGKLSNIKKQT